MKLNETKVHRLILDSPEKLLKGLKVIGSEVPLYSAIDLLSRDTREVIFGEGNNLARRIGRIDLVLRHAGKTYVTEIKYNKPTNTSSDFWEALKVLGYCEYYKWQTNEKNVHAAIVVPLHSIKLEQQIIAGKLKLAIFAIYEENNQPKLKLIGDEKTWDR